MDTEDVHIRRHGPQARNPIPPAELAGILGERALPQSREAEMSFLGALVMENDLIHEMSNKIKPEDLAYPAHQTIYRAILDHKSSPRDPPLDLVILRDVLSRDRKLEEVGGAEYLANLVESMPAAINAHEYARAIKEKAVLRKLIDACSQTIHNTFNITENVEDLVAAAMARIQSVARMIEDGKLKPTNDILRDVFQDVQSQMDRKADRRGYPTGFASLDEVLGGLKPGYYVIGARPKVGKTSLVLNMLEFLAINEKMPVAFITLESTPKEILESVLYSRARIDDQKPPKDISEEDYQKLIMAAGALHDSQLYIESARTPKEVITLARRAYQEMGAKVIATDYLQRAVRNTERENQELAQFSKELTDLAQQELRVPLIAICQVVKEVDRRDDKHPKLGDLYGPGSIGHDANAVLLLYRDDFYNPESMLKGFADIDIVQRRGRTARVTLKWEGVYRRFSDTS